MPALLPNRVRLQKIDSISASCLRMARGISASGERLELFMGQTARFRRELPRLHDRILEPVQHYGIHHSFSLLCERRGLTQLVTALAAATYPIPRRRL